MFAKTVLFVTFLIAAAASAARIQSASRLSFRLKKARRACKAQKPLICNISPVSSSSISGKVAFIPAFRVVGRKGNCYVRIRAFVEGLTGRMHGFHIHEYGDISSLDGTSTGGHFSNPEGTPSMHGHPHDDERHWGDFGNLRARRGVAVYNRVDKIITLEGIVGRGVTIHEGRDMGADHQPTGAAGPRMGVCVIGFAHPDSLDFS